MGKLYPSVCQDITQVSTIGDKRQTAAPLCGVGRGTRMGDEDPVVVLGVHPHVVEIIQHSTNTRGRSDDNEMCETSGVNPFMESRRRKPIPNRAGCSETANTRRSTKGSRAAPSGIPESYAWAESGRPAPLAPKPAVLVHNTCRPEVCRGEGDFKKGPVHNQRTERLNSGSNPPPNSQHEESKHLRLFAGARPQPIFTTEFRTSNTHAGGGDFGTSHRPALPPTNGFEPPGPVPFEHTGSIADNQSSFDCPNVRDLPATGRFSREAGRRPTRGVPHGLGAPFRVPGDKTVEAALSHDTPSDRERNEAYDMFELAIRGRSKKSAQGPVDYSLPLHVKDVSSWNWDVVDAAMAESQWKRIYNVCRNWTRAEYLDEICNSHYTSIMSGRSIMPAKLTDADIDLLLNKNRIRGCSQENIRCWVNVFCVMELEKMRRRIIAEPFLNDVCYEAWSLLLAMPGVEEQLAAIHYEGATVADYPWFYGQMPLEPAAMLFFGFLAWHEGKLRAFVLCDVPTGGRWVPGLAQAVARTITSGAVKDTEQTRPEFTNLVDESAYIDNSRLVGPLDSLKTLQTFFVCRARAMEVTLNDPPSEIATRYEHLGIMFDHNTKIVALSQRTEMKLRNMMANAPTTLRNLMQAVGLLIFCSKVLQYPLANGYYVFKFIRRRLAMGFLLDQQCWPWECVLLALNNWKQSLTNQHRHIRPIYEHNKQLQGVVFTDASLTGWGVTIFRGTAHNHISSGCGRFRRRENIAVLEARALLVGVEAALGEAVQPPGWNFFVDNTVVLGALKKGWSQNFVLNKLVLDIIARTAVGSFTFNYIPSANNLADTLSRIFVT
jgi:hypothetical protein